MIYFMVRSTDSPLDELRARTLVWIGTAAEWAAFHDATGRGVDRRARRDVPFKVLGMMDGDEAKAEALRREISNQRRDRRPEFGQGFGGFAFVELDPERWFWRPLVARVIRDRTRGWDGEDAAILGVERPKLKADAPPPKASLGLGSRVKNRRG